MAPSLSTDGAKENWSRGQDLNLRPSGYEGDFTQPADGRRPSCFQSSRVVSSSAKSTEVDAGIRKSLLFGQDLVKVRRATSNRRPSPWQGPDEPVHGDADSVKQAESEPVSRANRCSARQCSLFGQVLGSLSEGS